MSNINIQRLSKDLFHFILISGTAWLLDFGLFLIFSSVLGLNVLFSNLISTIPAFTFVFFVSSRKIFRNNTRRLTLKQKYWIYFIYQFVLVLSISLLGQWIYKLSHHFLFYQGFTDNTIKFSMKILITPITMIMNFITMKILTEKL